MEQVLSKEQSAKFAKELNSIRTNPAYGFERGKSAHSISMLQVQGAKQVMEVIRSSLPASPAKTAITKYLESEANYMQKISQLNQQRNVTLKELSTVIIGPDGRSIVPFAPLPMSDMEFVGWDKEGNEVYYNTDDGYYYTRDSAGGNSFSRFNGNYLDANGNQHNAERESENTNFWQDLYRFFGFDEEHISFPDTFINKWDLQNHVRPDNPWFRP